MVKLLGGALSCDEGSHGTVGKFQDDHACGAAVEAHSNQTKAIFANVSPNFDYAVLHMQASGCTRVLFIY